MQLNDADPEIAAPAFPLIDPPKVDIALPEDVQVHEYFPGLYMTGTMTKQDSSFINKKWVAVGLISAAVLMLAYLIAKRR